MGFLFAKSLEGVLVRDNYFLDAGTILGTTTNERFRRSSDDRSAVRERSPCTHRQLWRRAVLGPRGLTSFNRTIALRWTRLLFDDCKITEPRARLSCFVAGQCSSARGFSANGPAFLRRWPSRRLCVHVLTCGSRERSRECNLINFGVLADGVSAASGDIPARNAFDPNGVSLLWEWARSAVRDSSCAVRPFLRWNIERLQFFHAFRSAERAYGASLLRHGTASHHPFRSSPLAFAEKSLIGRVARW